MVRFDQDDSCQYSHEWLMGCPCMRCGASRYFRRDIIFILNIETFVLSEEFNSYHVQYVNSTQYKRPRPQCTPGFSKNLI